MDKFDAGLLITSAGFPYDTCPTCRAPYKEFGREVTYGAKPEIRLHTNGGQWWYIVFVCGRKDGFVPNFNRVEEQQPCQNMPSLVMRREKRQTAVKDLKTFIAALDVDDQFKQELDRSVRVP